MDIIITLKKTDKEYPVKLSRRDLKKLERKFDAKGATKSSGNWTIEQECPFCKKYVQITDNDCPGCPLDVFVKKNSKAPGCLQLLREILGDVLFFQVGSKKIIWMDCVDKVARHKLSQVHGMIQKMLEGQQRFDIY